MSPKHVRLVRVPARGKRHKRFRRIGSESSRWPPLYWMSPHLPRSCWCWALEDGIRYSGVAYVVCGIISLAVLTFDLLYDWLTDKHWLRVSRIVIISASSGLVVLVGVLNYLGGKFYSARILLASMYVHGLLVFMAGVSTILLFSSIFSRTHEARKKLLIAEGGFRTAVLLLFPFVSGPYVYSLMWRLSYRHYLSHVERRRNPPVETLSVTRRLGDTHSETMALDDVDNTK